MKLLFPTPRTCLVPKAKLVFEFSPKTSKDHVRLALTLRAVSWKATAWLPGKKVHGITKLKQATVTVDFGSGKWEGQMQFLAAGASKAVYALQDAN